MFTCGCIKKKIRLLIYTRGHSAGIFGLYIYYFKTFDTYLVFFYSCTFSCMTFNTSLQNLRISSFISVEILNSPFAGTEEQRFSRARVQKWR